MSCGFGSGMYFQGANKGTTAGVNAAVIFMTLNGRTKEAEEFLEFINDIATKKIKFDK
jgi:hypothetical protein